MCILIRPYVNTNRIPILILTTHLQKHKHLSKIIHHTSTIKHKHQNPKLKPRTDKTCGVSFG